MNPAYSIIFFTASSGAGYGLLAVLAVFSLLGGVSGDGPLALVALLVGAVLVTGGLVSSTYHLGHPERAWRALSQWGSSWLSREGVLAVLAYLPMVGLAAAWLLGRQGALVEWLAGGLLATAVLTVVCTGMIYASLRAIPRWATIWVPLAYLALGLMTGALWLQAIAALLGNRVPGLDAVVVVSIAIGGLVKLGYWGHVARAVPTSSVATAIGLDGWAGEGTRATPLESPHTEPNYILREMGYRVAQRHADVLRERAYLAAFALPFMLALLVLGFGDTWVGRAAAVLAALSGSLGVVVERWLFFAEAEHKVTLYYGRAAA